MWLGQLAADLYGVDSPIEARSLSAGALTTLVHRTVSSDGPQQDGEHDNPPDGEGDERRSAPLGGGTKLHRREGARLRRASPTGVAGWLTSAVAAHSEDNKPRSKPQEALACAHPPTFHRSSSMLLSYPPRSLSLRAQCEPGSRLLAARSLVAGARRPVPRFEPCEKTCTDWQVPHAAPAEASVGSVGSTGSA